MNIALPREPVSGLAASSPGFLWRLQTHPGAADAIGIRAFGDGRPVVNMSVQPWLKSVREFEREPCPA